MRLHLDSEHLKEERETLTDAKIKALGNKFKLCIITQKERLLKLMSMEGLLKRKAATAQSLPKLLHS